MKVQFVKISDYKQDFLPFIFYHSKKYVTLKFDSEKV
ncbi:hypothetical protein SAMN04488541_100582 [Thermoflexibacter ruber]|uniref:Uncharacterized protein n=1 Tax=Thermoflexibacter ruber TaxID=1003 RepID=A0A1I2CN17_9BACT|nr:hypothetical protein SAMN04488541_100582 [Thermoflexibacter ruber]